MSRTRIAPTPRAVPTLASYRSRSTMPSSVSGASAFRRIVGSLSSSASSFGCMPSQIPVEQADEQAQAEDEARHALQPGAGAQQQHGRPHVLGTAEEFLRLVRHDAPFRLHRGDYRVAELLLGLALRGRGQGSEGRVVLEIVTAWRVFADGRLQGVDKFGSQHVACSG